MWQNIIKTALIGTQRGKISESDKKAQIVEIQSDSDNVMGWKLIALSGGNEMDIFGEWNGEFLVPLSACVGGKFVNLT